MSPRLQRAAVAAVQVLGLAVWFSVSAVVPACATTGGSAPPPPSG